MWDIEIQDLKNQAFNQLSYAEWRSFFKENLIEEQQSKEPGDDNVFVFDSITLNKSALDNSYDLTVKSFLQEQNREANEHLAGMVRKSTLNADLNDPFSDKKGAGRYQSLLPLLQWEREDKQQFTDLFNLVKNGIPSNLRAFVWGELLQVRQYEK